MAKDHPNKEISKVIDYAIELGWEIIKGSGHVYATLRCPCHDRAGCQARVYSTPQNPGNFAKKLKHEIDFWPH